jgi:hypothetical protein
MRAVGVGLLWVAVVLTAAIVFSLALFVLGATWRAILWVFGAAP